MMRLKKSSIIFSVFIVFYFGEIALNFACGGEMDPYDYNVNYFHNNIQGDIYMPFAYAPNDYLYGQEEEASETDINAAEWAAYLPAKKEDVDSLMYHADSTSNLRLQEYADRSIKKLPDQLLKNTFASGLTKNKAALKYLVFAKSCEPLIAAGPDPWDPRPRDSTTMVQKGKEALKLISKVKKDPFLKLRYAFQAARLFHYAHDYTESKDTYEQYIKDLPSASAAKGWALSIYAGSLRKLGRPDEAAYLFSKVFDSNPERRVQTYKDYHFTGSKPDSILKFAKTNSERAMVLAVSAFGTYDYNIEMLKEIYRLNPASLINGALLTREVNKLEEVFNSRPGHELRYQEGTEQELKKARISTLNEVKKFALKLAEERLYPNPELGTITAAYLSWMNEENELAQQELSSLNPQKLNERLLNQYRITDLLIQSKKIKNGSAFNENELVPTLKWLDQKRFEEAKDNGSVGRFSITRRNFYTEVLKPAYLKMGDTAKAAICMLKGDLFLDKPGKPVDIQNLSYETVSFWRSSLTPKSMIRLNAYRNQKDSNTLNGLLADSFRNLNANDFNELFGTTYLRTHQYALALQYFNKLKNVSDAQSASFDETGPDPFIETINDYPKQDSSAITMNKKVFAQAMLKLEKLVVSNPKNAALYYYKMANAVYQTGYYGNSWYLISYDWSSYTYDDPPVYSYDVDYKEAKTAFKWYLKARALSNNANFKAKCTFMLAKCEQKQIAMKFAKQTSGYSTGGDDLIKANYANPYFKELSLKYAKTPFYTIASSECSYMSDFIK